MVAPDLAPGLKVAASLDDEGAAAAAAEDRTATLPDELLAVVFNFCDAQTQMMAIPAVSKRWLCIIGQRNAAIDLTWAVREYRCAITDAGLAGLVRRFPNLQHIDLTWCENVTDGGLTAVAAGCPNLQHLDLSYCESVTDGGLVAVAAGCPNLQHLTLNECKNVTGVGAALFPNAGVLR